MNSVAVASSAGSRSISYAGFDPVGRERSRTETEIKNGTSTSAATTWTYDELGRLSSAVRHRGLTTVLNQQFTYDPLGNLLGLSNSVTGPDASFTTMTYSAVDRDRICRIAFGP